jgi:hypothetical protein
VNLFHDDGEGDSSLLYNDGSSMLINEGSGCGGGYSGWEGDHNHWRDNSCGDGGIYGDGHGSNGYQDDYGVEPAYGNPLQACLLLLHHALMRA